MEQVNEALKRIELVYCEMEPGDTLSFLFHCNTLHRSAQNNSRVSALVAHQLLQREAQQSL